DGPNARSATPSPSRSTSAAPQMIASFAVVVQTVAVSTPPTRSIATGTLAGTPRNVTASSAAVPVISMALAVNPQLTPLTRGVPADTLTVIGTPSVSICATPGAVCEHTCASAAPAPASVNTVVTTA